VTADEPTNAIGKRYRCPDCGLELLCVKAGDGRFGCHGQPMELLEVRRLPASD
jgi:Desulfoferrodoxin, N-terminal domain